MNYFMNFILAFKCLLVRYNSLINLVAKGMIIGNTINANGGGVWVQV